MASIQNVAQIESACGTATALTVRHVVYERARDFCSHKSSTVTCSGGAACLSDERAVREPVANVYAVRSDYSIAEAVVAALGAAPMLTSTGPIRAAITASAQTCDGTSFDPEKEAFAKTRIGTRKWGARYARRENRRGTAVRDGTRRAVFQLREGLQRD
ncbi:hypothetical protein ACW9YV_10995 [Paraburkholderia strydomiana]